MDCLNCQRVFEETEKRAAGISIFVMGDEYIYSYWRCPQCDKWTIESYHDRFLGEASIGLLGPFPTEVGARCVQLIQACPRPFDKHCECPSHDALYTGLPRDSDSD